MLLFSCREPIFNVMFNTCGEAEAEAIYCLKLSPGQSEQLCDGGRSSLRKLCTASDLFSHL